MAELLEELLKQKRAQQEASEFAHIAVRQEWISNCENLITLRDCFSDIDEAFRRVCSVTKGYFGLLKKLLAMNEVENIA